MTTISPERIAQIEARRDELQAQMATGDLPSDRFVAVSKEYAELEPVAQAASEVLCGQDDVRLPEGACTLVTKLAHYVRDIDEHRRLRQDRRPAIVISASG